jgi:HK97 family phage prohead protease
MKTERRFFSKAELRSEQVGSTVYVSGYSAVFDQESEDLGGFREVIKPGCFSRALAEKQDVRCLQNHNPNLILGRTKSGTLALSEDAHGLRFRCALPQTQAGDDVAELLSRGDLDQCSFAFVAVDQAWIETKDADGSMTFIRELRDVDLIDCSLVCYPAYPNTSAGLSRSLFPDGAPSEVRSHLAKRTAADDTDTSECECECDFCEAGDHDNCDPETCGDPENCRCSAERSKKPGAGEDDHERAKQRERALALAEQSW